MNKKSLFVILSWDEKIKDWIFLDATFNKEHAKVIENYYMTKITNVQIINAEAQWPDKPPKK